MKTREAIRIWLIEHVGDVLGLAPEKINTAAPFGYFGLTSLDLVGLAGALEDWLGWSLSPTLIYDYPSIDALAGYLAAHPEPGPEAGGRPDGMIAPEPIAIVGIGCRFPGATGPEAFWRLLLDGVDAITEVPADRWDAEAFYDPRVATPGKMNTKWGGFVSDVDKFDASFFGLSPREAARVDPQQRLALEVAWEALEDAGISPQELAGSSTGTFIGIGSFDYSQFILRNPVYYDAYAGTGNSHSIAANRLSYVLDLRGPSVAIDTACSASLVAIHMACLSLRQGESDLALAGGVNLILSPFVNVALSQARMMASDGRCKTFDARADGYVRSDGCGVVVLRRLSDAIEAGDRIYAVIRSTAVNHDGHSNGLTAPNGLAQQAVIREALRVGDVRPADISMFEAHGTGTSLGDPIEVDALKAVMLEGRSEDQPLLLGSVKTNIGHLETAAGVAGVIKSALALYHGQIPRHLHVSTLNPLIHLEGAPITIPQETTPWPPSAQRRLASVSAFGFGGTNAHAILEEAPASRVGEAPADRPVHLLTLSAQTAKALRELAGRHAEYLESHPEVSLADVCYTLNTGRARFDHRLALTVEDIEQAAGALRAFVREETSAAHAGAISHGTRPVIAFLFTGQGSQYPDMGRALYETSPVFKEAMDRCDELLRGKLGRPLLSVLYGDSDDTRLLDQTAYTQPALFAIEYALAQVWKAWGITPAYVLGHSVGEYAAACVAGAYSLEDALTLIAERGRLMQALPSGGKMAALMTDRKIAAEAIAGFEDRVSLAALNGPASVVISGEGAAVDAIAAELKAKRIRVTYLNVSHAFHSPLMAPALDEFEAVASALKPAPLKTPLASNVTGEVIPVGAIIEPSYWRKHVRGAVCFEDGMKTLEALGATLYLEIGPSPVLLSMGMRCVNGDKAVWLHSLKKGAGDWRTMLEALGGLFVAGAPVNFRRFDRDYPRRKLSLPTYPFQRMRFWIGPAAGAGAPPSAEEVTSAQVEERGDGGLENEFYELSWRKAATETGSKTNGRPQAWLVLADRSGFGEALAAALRKRGAACLVAGAGFAEQGDRFELDPASQHDVERLIKRAAQTLGRPLTGIAHCWRLDVAPAMGAAVLEEDETLGCVSTLNVIKALGAMTLDPKPRLWIVTRNAHKVGGSPQIPDVTQNPVWGLGRVAALEQPESWGGLIDVLDETDAGAVAEELLWPGGDNQLAFRNGARYVAKLTRLAADEKRSAPPLRFRPGGAYLITGGLGGLGLQIARWMVSQGARRLVLMGRTPLPPRTEWAALERGHPRYEQVTAVRELESMGASVSIAAVDVGDKPSLRAWYERYRAEAWPPICGVIHAAGALRDRSLQQLAAEDFAPVFHSKVRGGWFLHEMLEDAPLDFFVLFSSAASLLGSAGQGNYAAANAFLDGLAHYRRAQGKPALSVNWGPWAEVGMAARQSRGANMAAGGVTPIAPAEGAAAMRPLIQCGAAQVGVFRADWQTLKSIFAGTNTSFFGELAEETGADEASHAQYILDAAPQERHRLIDAYVKERVADIIHMDVAAIPETYSVVELGLDSIMVMELIRAIGRDLKFRIHPREVFEQPSLAALISYLANELGAFKDTSVPLAPDGVTADELDTWMIGKGHLFKPEKCNPPCGFVLCSPRSGSTLFRVMLAGHPDLFCPPELHMLPFYSMLERHEALKDARYMGEGLIRAYMELKGLEADRAQEAVDDWIRSDRKIEDVYGELQELARPRMLVDKSPSYSKSLATLGRAEELFDKPLYVYLIRHPYSVIESVARNRMGKLSGVGGVHPEIVGQQVWLRRNRCVLEFIERIDPARVCQVKYEELVREPEGVMRSVCGFLGVPYDPAVIHPYEGERMTRGLKAGDVAVGDPDFNKHSGIDPALGDKWKRIRLELPLDEDCRALAERFGYELPHETVSADAGVDEYAYEEGRV